MVHQQQTGTRGDETPDDATVVSVAAVSLPVDELQLQPAAPAATAGGPAKADKQPSSPSEEAPPLGLTDQTNFLPTKQVITVFLGLSVALACSFLDQTIIATALPRIASDLHSGRESSWVATAYLLTSLSFTPLYGRWSDVFGRKIVLLVSLFVFLVFSLACALAQTMIQLIIFRAFQGIGGGAIITMVLIIVSDIVSLKDRGKYQGINEAVIALSNGFGPVIGGLFAEYTTWRWAFWINLPLGGIAIAVGIWLLPLKKVHGAMREKLVQIDYVGSFLTIASSILLLLGLNWGGVTYPWGSAPVLVPLLLGGAVFALFLFWEARFAKLPIIPVHIFKVKTVSGVYIATMMNGMAFFSILYYVPQFLQLVRGSSPVISSLLLLPFLAPISFVVFLCGQYSSRTGHYRYLIIFGYGVWCIAQGLQSTIDEHSSIGKVVGTLLMAGIASGFTFQTSLLAAQAAVPRHEMAVVTGVRNFVRLFGSTIALAICASLVNNTLRTAIVPLGLTPDQIEALVDDPTIINQPSVLDLDAHGKAVVIAAYTKGFHSVFYLTVACTGIAFLASVFLIEQHELNRADDQELKRQAKEELAKRKLEKKEKDLEAAHSLPELEKEDTQKPAAAGGDLKVSDRAGADRV
ncbi:MFS general substrate transporter [Phanerochaete sordida]|uniref:MFS general substrate transporter n=1 Tax=Phanerochaete sordida TaxID=48140 RepID=A0A9P3GH10_9APHY|nr:MFS general substrate transporter [Phanerochaete sordida]